MWLILMSRFGIIFLSLFLALSLPVAADDKADLTALLNDFLTTPDQGSYANHDRFWAEELVYTGSAGTRVTKKIILEGAKAWAANKAPVSGPSPTYSAEDIDIRLYGTMAVVAFKLVAKTPKGDTVTVQKYYNTGTFIKRANKWQAVAWQATKIPVE